MTSLASAARSFFSVVLIAFLLATAAVSAFSPLPTEEYKWSPAITAMATFSSLEITGYTLLVIAVSYSLFRLYRFLKSYVLSSTAGAALPQPVSASRISYISLYSPFTFLRSRQKSSRIPRLTQNRWSPFSAIFRRLTRPSSPLHLSGTESLPTTMPNSPSAHTRSLIDFPLVSISPSRPVAERCSSQFGQTRKLSKSSSIEALPSYRPLTPVPAMDSLPAHVASPPPSTPPPPSPGPYPGMRDTDIQLVPITPRKRHTHVTAASSSNPATPPPTDTFPAINPSPFNLTAIPSSGNHVGPKSKSSSPCLSSSRTLSSLSLSPQSLYMQQHKRSKSLGGVAVKKISPTFNSTKTPSESEGACENSVNADIGVDPTQPRLTDEGATAGYPLVEIPSLVPLPAGFPKFHLNLSSSSLSSGSSSSRSSEPLSPSPLTANSESPPSSAPLRTPRTISNASYPSDDIVKPSENDPLLPLGDVGMNIDTDSVLGYTADEKVSGWRFDAGEPVSVSRVLEDFDDTFTSVPSYAKVTLSNSAEYGRKKTEERLGNFEEMGMKMDVERIREDRWEWDEDVENQLVNWRQDTGSMVDDAEDAWHLESEGAEFEFEDEPEGTDFFSSEMVHLSETIKVLAPLLNKPTEVPVISICTQDDVLCRQTSGFDSGLVSSSSVERATPVSLGQTPTPPVSPPREARITPLPKVNKSLQDQTLNGSTVTSPVAECPSVAVRIEAQEQGFWRSAGGDKDNDDTPIGTNVSLVHDAPGVQETKELVPFLDKPLVNSPASMSDDLPESDGEYEFTFNFEADEDNAIRFGGSGDDLESQDGMVGEEGDQQVSEIDAEFSVLPPVDEVEDCDQGRVEERTGEPKEVLVNENTEFVNKNLEDELTGDSVSQTIRDPDAESVVSPTPTEPTFGSTAQTARKDAVLASAAVAIIALQLTASVPGAFPGAAPEHIFESTSEPVQRPCSPPLPQRQHRTRTPLEEAIARTRSPLEVALAMQLRPGLRSGADPAWMVRFLIVMWGWAFGLALGTTEA